MIEDMFYAISKDGLLYQSEKIKELPQSDSILCYLKSSDEYIHDTGKNTYRWYRYEFVDINENPVKFRIGTCEVVYIEKDDGISYLRSREFTIRDQYSREGKFVIRAHYGNYDYHYLESIATKLVPFMLELSSYGGWDGYWSKKYPLCPNADRTETCII